MYKCCEIYSLHKKYWREPDADAAGEWGNGGRAEEAELAAAAATMTSGGWTNPRMRRAAVLAAMTYVSAATACASLALVFIPLPPDATLLRLLGALIRGELIFWLLQGLRGGLWGCGGVRGEEGVVSSLAAAPAMGFSRERKGQ